MYRGFTVLKTQICVTRPQCVNSSNLSDPVLSCLIFALRLQNIYALAHTAVVSVLVQYTTLLDEGDKYRKENVPCFLFLVW
jgi:hypothetical protein